MDRKTVAAVLGALGLILILAGPAFHLIDSTLGIFLALSCWVIGGLLSGLGKKEKKEPKEKEQEEEQKE